LPGKKYKNRRKNIPLRRAFEICGNVVHEAGRLGLRVNIQWPRKIWSFHGNLMGNEWEVNGKLMGFIGGFLEWWYP